MGGRDRRVGIDNGGHLRWTHLDGYHFGMDVKERLEWTTGHIALDALECLFLFGARSRIVPPGNNQMATFEKGSYSWRHILLNVRLIEDAEYIYIPRELTTGNGFLLRCLSIYHTYCIPYPTTRTHTHEYEEKFDGVTISVFPLRQLVNSARFPTRCWLR